MAARYRRADSMKPHGNAGSEGPAAGRRSHSCRDTAFVVVSVTPVVYDGNRAEVHSHQLGKPENVKVENVPARTPVKVD